MPKTDKQISHEKRLKAMERMDRKKARRARLAGEPEGGFEIVDKQDIEVEEENKLDNLSEKERKKVMEAKALIKAGLGNNNIGEESKGFEVVSLYRPMTLKKVVCFQFWIPVTKKYTNSLFKK